MAEFKSAYGGVSAGLRDVAYLANTASSIEGNQVEIAYKRQEMQQKAKMDELAYNKAAFQDRQLKEEEERGNKVYSLGDYLGSQGISKETQDHITNHLKVEGFLTDLPSGGFGIKQKYVSDAIKSVSGNVQFMQEVDKIELDSTVKQIGEIQKVLQDPATKDKDKEKLTAQLQQLTQKKNQLDNSIINLNDKLKQEQLKGQANLNKEVLKAAIKGQSQTSNQEKGVTEKGGFTVSYDPKQAKNFVTKPDGTYEDYDPQKHGKILSTALSQTTVINNQEKGLSTKELKVVENMKKGIREGRMAPSQLNVAIQRMGGGKSSGAIRQAIVSELLEEGFDMAKAEANFKGITSSGAIAAGQLVNATTPLVKQMRGLVGRLPKEVRGLGPLNTLATEGKRAIAKFSGDKSVVEFETLRNKLVEETERLLTSVGAMADTRVKRNLDNLRTGYNTKQMQASLTILNDVIEARLKAVQSPIYNAVQGGRDFVNQGQPARPLPKF